MKGAFVAASSRMTERWKEAFKFKQFGLLIVWSECL
jgi:hypothetical protein